MTPIPTGKVYPGEKVCYRVEFGLSDIAPVDCDVIDFDANLIFPGVAPGPFPTVGVPWVLNQNLTAPDAISCFSGDSRCALTEQEHCYTVSLDDDVVSLNGCPPTLGAAPQPNQIGRVVAYYDGLGDSLTGAGDFVAPCVTANNPVARCEDGVRDAGICLNSSPRVACGSDGSCPAGTTCIGRETCDDGNKIDTDACRNNCTFCGDNELQGTEQCDGSVFEPGAPPGRACRTDCTFCGDGLPNGPALGQIGHEFCDDGNNIDDDDCSNLCTLPCNITVSKTVALDDNCDGIENGAFGETVTQDDQECVVYRICVTNDGLQVINNVTVNDSGLGAPPPGGTGGGLDFGSVAAGATECQDIPGEANVGDCSGGSCLCTTVEGTNTATVATAICADTNDSACAPSDPDCDDTAEVICEPCSATVVKTVAVDDNCDGLADGTFGDSVIQDDQECVVYKVCVTNTGNQNLTNVTVNDSGAGGFGGTLNFGTILATNPDTEVCQLIPGNASIGACAGGTCVCTAVEGLNTATITNATCALDGNACGATPKPGSVCTDTATVECRPCSATVVKTVAADDNCDGLADGTFGDSVIQDDQECVVYKVCVTNTGDQDLSNVTVNDTGAGGFGGTLNFGTILATNPDTESCQLIPGNASVGQCAGGTCVCTAVEGPNTATITNATCALDGNACGTTPKPGSVCTDTATVECRPCSVVVTKKVAEDLLCDGIADGAFGDLVTVNINECVVYEVCVTNTGDQDLSNVTVNDTGAGGFGGTLNFGTILATNPDTQVCQLIPGDVSIGACAGGTCVCTAVEGPNTATITNATCALDGNACPASPALPKPGSDCEDTAEVRCENPLCQVNLEKTISEDKNCDGDADTNDDCTAAGVPNECCTGALTGSCAGFVENVTVDKIECVVYKVCLSNSGTAEFQYLNASTVTLTDSRLGINTTVDFGMLAPGQEECREIPSVLSAPVCDGPDGTPDTDDDVCICQDVQGTNTASVDGVICVDTGAQACDEPGSQCTDNAKSNCEGGCRITAGRTNRLNRMTDGAKGPRGQGGGQVGAPCGCSGCFTTGDPLADQAFEHIQGNWQYSRKCPGGDCQGEPSGFKIGTFHAKEFNSLICGCCAEGLPNCAEGSTQNPSAGACFRDEVGVATFSQGQICGDRFTGPLPRPAGANTICFSGIADWTDTNGRKYDKIAFRVEAEDRGEPSVGKNSDETCDYHRIRMWFPTGSCSNDASRVCRHNSDCNGNSGTCVIPQSETAEFLADAVCCTRSNDADGNVKDSICPPASVRLPNIDDGGNLLHGNIQIHPELPNTRRLRCPVPDGVCQQPVCED